MKMKTLGQLIKEISTETDIRIAITKRDYAMGQQVCDKEEKVERVTFCLTTN